MNYFLESRREYISDSLSRKDLNPNPFMQFEKWMNDAIKFKIDMPNAMSLATSDTEVSIRTVLLKNFDKNGFVFFTNYNSKKATQIKNNPQVALLFPWLSLDRQVKISGKIEKISMVKSLKYFISRPLESQIAATCSKQSGVVSTRDELMFEFNKIKQKFKDGKMPLPDNWGGYSVIPQTIEFWQGRKNRMHDRFIYTKKLDNWDISRLNP